MTREIIADQGRFLFKFSEPMLEGLNDSHLALEPVQGNKSAGWILGHLCITGDFGRRLCGRGPMSPKNWRDLFTPGTSSGSTPAEAYPRMSELVRAFKDIYGDFPDALISVEDAALDQPNPFEPARAGFPTVRHFVVYMVTGHLSYHLAQLGDWRRASGLGHKGYL